jgi:hypothetical protein
MSVFTQELQRLEREAEDKRRASLAERQARQRQQLEQDLERHRRSYGR